MATFLPPLRNILFAKNHPLNPNWSRHLVGSALLWRLFMIIRYALESSVTDFSLLLIFGRNRASPLSSPALLVQICNLHQDLGQQLCPRVKPVQSRRPIIRASDGVTGTVLSGKRDLQRGTSSFTRVKWIRIVPGNSIRNFGSSKLSFSSCGH